MGTSTIISVALLAQAVGGILVWILAKRGSQKVIDQLVADNARLTKLWSESVELSIDQAGAMGEAVLKMYKLGTDEGRAMAPILDRPAEWNYGDDTHPVGVATDLARFRLALRQLDGLPNFDYQGIPRVSL